MFKPSRLSLAVILLSLIELNLKEPSMITVPIKVIENSFEKFPISRETELSYEREIEVKTIFGPKIRRLKEVISGTIKILNSHLFCAPISIGSANSQHFNVILDTGSINLWVPKNNSEDAYKIDNHFEPSLSPTATKTPETFSVRYGTGLSEGSYYSDKVNFISTGNYEIKFGVATKTDFNVKGADGIMGLARKYKSNDYSSIFTLNTKGVIPTKSFSFKYIKANEVEMYLGEEHSDFSNENNTAQCQLLHKTTYDNTLWTCKLYNFGFISEDNERNITASCGYNLLFDTGSNIMILPLETLDYLSNRLSTFNCTKVNNNNNGQQILCENKDLLPNVFIEVGNHYLIIDHNEMFSQYISNGVLIGYVLNAVFQDTDMPIMGQNFFKLFHTKFDPENKVLKFYNEDSDKLRYSTEKPYDDEARTFGTLDTDPFGWLNENSIKIIAAVVIFIALLVVLCYFYRCCKRLTKSNKI